MATVAGAYRATTFTARPQQSGATTDLLALGATLTIALDASGTTRGRLFVPGGDENGSQAADTFMRDMPFVVADSQLAGAASLGGTVVRVVLGRQ